MTARLIPVLIAAACLFAFCLRASAQVVTLTAIAPANTTGTFYSDKDVTLAAGDHATIITQHSQFGGAPAAAVQIGNIEYVLPAILSSSPGSGGGSTVVPGQTIEGPARIRATTGYASSAPSARGAFITVLVQRAGAGSPSVTPSGAAVIPEEPAGQFKVILESSTDMITWTPANPGTYGGNTTKRFFRTRIEKQP